MWHIDKKVLRVYIIPTFFFVTGGFVFFFTEHIIIIESDFCLRHLQSTTRT